MKNIKFLILFISLILSEARAEIIIFGVTKEETILNNNINKLEKIFVENKELFELDNDYYPEYLKDKFGDNYAISISNINNDTAIKSLIILLRPTFNDIFIVSSVDENIVNIKQNRDEASFPVKIFFVIILGLFGLIILYKLFRKLIYINKIQKSFKDNQDILQDRIDSIG